MKYIGLLDCNNFFVSCERLFRPDLKTVPTIVLSGNDGCAVARSKEIKELGIPMGVPYFQVKKELDDANAAIFSSNFPLYRDISRRVMEILRQEVGFVEQYSVDEAFFSIDVDENGVLDVLSHIKHTVEDRVGVPVSVGAAKTKTIAKYASEVGKKGEGVAFVVGDEWKQLKNEVPVNVIWGIGRQTSQKMREHGIATVSELLATERPQIQRLFGIGGLRLCDELSEKQIHTLGGKKSDQKSIMSTRSFKQTTTDIRVLEDAIGYHVAHVAKELREMDVKAGWLSVTAGTSRHGDWLLQGGRDEVILLKPTNDTRVLLKEAHGLLKSIYKTGIPYKKAGVVVGNFTDTSHEQFSLFSEVKESEKDDGVMKTIDDLNSKFGKETVTVGRYKLQEKWGSSRKFVSPCYTTNWDNIREINA